MGVSSSNMGVALCLLALLGFFSSTHGHGRLIDPPSRSTMWRYGFSTQPNYNDHELYCGGLSRQIKNNGKCGVCGDPWDAAQPRANEAGGKYGTGAIVRKYKQGSSVRIKVELTANHKGYFEFRLCPNNNPKRIVTQTCLDKYLLTQSDGSGARYFPGAGNKVFEAFYQLPPGLTCTQCVFQWRYIAGNNWGKCTNGSEGMGCGSQEEFRACADVLITDKAGVADSTESTDIDQDINDVNVPVHKDINNDVPNDIDDNNNDYDSVKFKRKHETFYVGFIIAAAGLVFAILLLAAVILYFSRGRDMIKQLLHKTATSGKSQQYDVPHNGTSAKVSHNGTKVEPLRPPRGVPRKPPLCLPESIPAGRLSANNISRPTSVTINGVTLQSEYPPV